MNQVTHVFQWTLLILLLLSLAGMFMAAMYVGYRAGWAKAVKSQAVTVEETLFQLGRITRPTPMDLAGTQLGSKFQEHLNAEKAKRESEVIEYNGKDKPPCNS